MATFKTFKVVAISSNANSFGLHGHVLMAWDGETWEVGRTRYVGPSGEGLWQVGDEIKVPYWEGAIVGYNDDGTDKQGYRPLDWGRVGVEIPAPLPRAPRQVVRQVWGEAAIRQEYAARCAAEQ